MKNPLFLLLFCLGLAASDAQETSTKKMAESPLREYFGEEDFLPQSEHEPDPEVMAMPRLLELGRSGVASRTSTGTCAVVGNPMTVGSPDRRYTFTFARLTNCGLDVVLISRGVDIRVNGRVVKNWERRRLALGEMKELLFRKGAGQNLRVASISGGAMAAKDEQLLQRELSLPGWLADLVKAIVQIFDEVCQFFGGDKTLCKLGESALKLLADTTIKKIKDDIVIDKHSIIPTLFFANCGRFGCRKESMEAYVWTASVLQTRSDYTPAERLYLVVTQTMTANNDARAGQAWASTIEQLPR